MVGVADPITPAGASQLVVDKYAVQFAEEKAAAFKAAKLSGYVAPRSKLLMLWNQTDGKGYTTFDPTTGSPIATTPAAQGTNHCNFTTSQLLMVAKTLVSSGETGQLPRGGALVTAVRKAGSLAIDPLFRAPLLKYYNEQG
ncbi:unannotated protein [freshwater metagenome]|uniref:Unannotated protein n=1 Tax=freshwater metagenome TaxID=449393 RepID=A0A6J7QL08_9ZZZZ